MTLAPDDVEKIRQIIDARSERTDEVIGKLEERIFDEIEKVAKKVDALACSHQIVNDRVTKLEVVVSNVESSKKSQGERIGELAIEVAKLKAHKDGSDGAAGKTGEWVRWVVPVILTIGAGISGIIVGGLK